MGKQHVTTMIFWKNYIKNNKLTCMDVNLGVISRFEHCYNLKELEGFDELPEEIKALYNEDLDFKKENYLDCLDLLGVYIAPTNNDKANILLSREKISDVAGRCTIDSDNMYTFIKIHEYAHGAMCPFLELAMENTQEAESHRIIRNAAYVIIEESLATAMALKWMKDTPDYNKLKSFLENQPLQYRYGLTLLSKFESDIEILMEMWKQSKCTFETYVDFTTYFTKEKSEENLEDFKDKLFEITDDVYFLSEAAKDIFVF